MIRVQFFMIPLALLLVAAWAAAAPPVPLPLGAEAPDFKLPGVDDKEYTLADFQDAEVLAIVFTCNHCPTAQAYEERLQDLHDDLNEKGVAMVAVSPNDPLAVRLDELGYTDVGDSLDDMKLRAEEKEFTFPYLYDGETQAMSKEYGPLATPHVFVFDKERKLRYTGRIDDSAEPENVESSDMRNAIEALLAGREVPVPQTRMFGCSTKWSDKRASAVASLKQWNEEEASLDTIDEEGVAALVANDTEKLRVINVWATWCGPCREEFPSLVEIHRMYRKRPFELVTISADTKGAQKEVEKFLNEEHASCSNYLFVGKNEYALADALDEKWQGPLPYTLVVAPGGKVLYRHQGPLEPLELKRAIVAWTGRVYK